MGLSFFQNVVMGVIRVRFFTKLTTYARLIKTPVMRTGIPKSGDKPSARAQKSEDGIFYTPEAPGEGNGRRNQVTIKQKPMYSKNEEGIRKEVEKT